MEDDTIDRSPKRPKLGEHLHEVSSGLPQINGANDPSRKSAESGKNFTPKHELQGHTAGVSAVKISPDGLWLASAAADSTIKIWWLDSGSLDQTLSGHSKGLSDISWSEDSELVVSASDDLTLRIWSVLSGRTVRVLEGHTNFVQCCQFNRYGNLIASGSFDETIKIWDVRTGQCLKTLPAHSDPIASVRFNCDGTMLVSCSHDGLIRIWDTASGQCLKTLVDQDSPPVSFATFSPNGRILLSCTLDSTIRLWDFVSSHPLKTYKGHKNLKYVLNAELSNDRIIIGGEDGKVTVWSTQTKEITQVIHASNEVVLSVALHRSAQGIEYLATAGLDRVIRVYQLEA